MWKKGELVWVRLHRSDSWIPGRILDPSEPFGILVSFFDLMEPRYVTKSCLRSFERDFGALIADSWRFRHFVNRALQTHFWNISFGLWCSCQQPIDSPYLDREISLPLSPLSFDSALGFVQEMAVSRRVPLRRLAETNSLTAQILSFRRYTVDLKRSESVYEEVKESAKLMDRAEVDSSRDLSPGDPSPKDIHCCSVQQPFDKVIQSWNTINSDSSVMKACATMARTSNNEDAAHSLKSREHCQVEQSICFQNSESFVEDIMEEDTTDSVQREEPHVVMIEVDDDIIGSDDITVTSAEQLSPLLDGSNDKGFLGKPVSLVVPEDCNNRSVEETSTNPTSKLDSSVINANTLDEDPSVGNHFDGTRENCPDDGGIAPAEQLQELEVATTVNDKTSAVDNNRSIGGKRKASRDKTSLNSKRRKKASQQSISADKPPQNLQLLKDKRFADPKCLRMKFLSRYGDLPSKSELLKRFSVFGKIDASRTDVNPGGNSAKVVFLKSINAVTAYQFARSKKFKLGRSKVMYRLDAFKEDNEVNEVPLAQKPQQSVPSLRSCLKKHGSVGKEEGTSHRKVSFQMATNSFH